MIPDSLKNLARAGRDFAELTMIYKDPRALCGDIAKAFSLIIEQQQTIADLQGRINGVRNARDEMLTDINQIMKKYDFTLRAV